MTVFMRHVEEDRVALNTIAFHHIDKDNSGQIDQEEMILEMQELCSLIPNLEFTCYEVEKVFRRLDIDKTGQITYTQFCFATLPSEVLNDESLQRRIFKDLDIRSEGFLTVASYQISLQRKGIEVPEEAIEHVFKANGYEPRITFELFKEMLCQAHTPF